MKRGMMLAAAVLSAAACTDDPASPETGQQPVPDWVETETYAGGRLGTTFNVSASAFEDPTPAVENAGMVRQFKHGEMIFEHNYGPTSEPFVQPPQPGDSASRTSGKTRNEEEEGLYRLPFRPRFQ